MKITIFAPGSRGDVQPYIALGKGLKDAGHEVRFVTHQDFESLVAEHNLEFWPVTGNVQDIAESPEIRALIEKGNFISLISRMAKEAEGEARRFAADGLAAARGTDLLLGGMGGLFVGVALAEKLDIPFIQAYLFPFTPTTAFPGPLTPGLPPLGALNWLSHMLTRQMIWQGFRSADTKARRDALGLPPGKLLGPFSSASTRGMPVLYGFSPAVIPPPADWGKDVHVTGYWFLDEAQDWTPPAELVNFLEAGPPPVYIGFGSMSSRRPEETAELVLQALERAGQRAVLFSGWGGLKKADLPGSIYMTGPLPHAWLFPRTAAVVHHGGAGTTGAGLRAGVPAIVIPFFGDQPFWGLRVARLGVGPQPIPRKKLSVERLARALEQAATDAEMRRRAASLGETIRAEDGVARAVEVIGRLSTP